MWDECCIVLCGNVNYSITIHSLYKLVLENAVIDKCDVRSYSNLVALDLKMISVMFAQSISFESNKPIRKLCTYCFPK